MSDKVCIVTGGTSGIGLAAAQALRKKGVRVYTVSRRALPENPLHLSADITDAGSVQRAVQQVLAKEKTIDILVNCAGYGISGAIEFTPEGQAKSQFDVNFFGLVNMTKEVIPVMRRQGYGRIVNISSVAAPAAIPFQAFYSASKAAINAYSCALANELRPYGVTVTAIQPGDIATGFTAARNKIPDGDEAYGGRISKSVKKMENDEQNGMAPAVAGEYIAVIALRKRVKPLYAIGFVYKAICVLLKVLPSRLANYIIYLMYAK